MSSHNASTPAPALDLEASPVPHQVGWAIMDTQGQIVKSSDNGGEPSQDWPLLFQMLQQVTATQELLWTVGAHIIFFAVMQHLVDFQ